MVFQLFSFFPRYFYKPFKELYQPLFQWFAIALSLFQKVCILFCIIL